jgi:hypothetical protein
VCRPSSLGKYIISDRPITEEEWTRERATVIDVTREVRTALVIRALGRITAVLPGPRWPRVFDADALGAFLDHARAMGMGLSDAGKWGRSRWSSRGFLTFGCLLCLAGRSFSALTASACNTPTA